jgi:hypothetical protein
MSLGDTITATTGGADIRYNSDLPRASSDRKTVLEIV